MKPGPDESRPDIIKGRSLIKKNTEVATDLDTIRHNKNTILYSICPQEDIPPQQTASSTKLVAVLVMDSNNVYQKNKHSSYISAS